VVYDFGNDGDVTGIRASFKEYDCTRSMKSGFRKGRHHVLPLPTSTKRVKFESSYNEWCQIIIASSLKRPVAAETAKNALTSASEAAKSHPPSRTAQITSNQRE
jgi:hypothetical protein